MIGCRDRRSPTTGFGRRVTGRRYVAEAGERLGLLLMKAGIISERQLNDALEVHKATGSPLGRVLVDLGYATQGAILSVMAQQIGIPYIDFAEQQAGDRRRSRSCRRTSPTRYTLMPVEFDEQNRLVVAMADPQNVLALDDLRIITGYEIVPAISTKDDIIAAIEEHYKVAEHVDEDLGDPDDLTASRTATLSPRSPPTRPIVKLVNYIITKAVADRASDIHIEPQEKDLRVRYRIDGVLHEIMRSPKSVQQAHHQPLQDHGRHGHRRDRASRRTGTLRAHDQRAQARLPRLHAARPSTASGSSCVSCARTRSCCAWRTSASCRPALERFESSFRKPYGAILVTGPTGSGKSTTLYAAINVLNDPGRHIITAEDPVEYRLPGVNQMQTNAKAGLTFARRAALVPALLARRHPRRRDPRPGDGQDRDRVGPHRPPGALHAAHQRRAVGASPVSPRWASSRSSSRPRSTACSPSASRAGCARTARRSTSRQDAGPARRGLPRGQPAREALASPAAARSAATPATADGSACTRSCWCPRRSASSRSRRPPPRRSSRSPSSRAC